MSNVAFVYMTAKDKAEAIGIARGLVEERLAACANVFNHTTSLYWWQGAVQEESEVGLILKTTEELVARVIARVKECHSYSCPCVLSWTVQAGNADFLDWVRRETATQGREAAEIEQAVEA